MRISPYGLLLLAGIVVSICFWARLVRRDERLIWIYISALIGAFVGAKVFYFVLGTAFFVGGLLYSLRVIS